MNTNKFNKKSAREVFKKLNIRKIIFMIWKSSRRTTLISLALLILENIGWIASIYMLKVLVDIAANPDSNNSHDLLWTVVYTGIVSILYACTKSISSYSSELQATKVNLIMDEKIHRHTIDLDYKYYEDPKYFDILKRAQEAGTDKPFAIVMNLFAILKNLIMISSIGYLLIVIDWKLLPLLGILVLPILIGRIIYSNKGFELYLENTAQEREAGYLSNLLTSDSSAKEIRTFNLGNLILSKFILVKNKLIDKQLALSKKRAINELITTGGGTAAFFGLTAYVVFGTLNGSSSVGDIAVFLVIFPQCFSIMQNLVANISGLYRNNMFVNLIFELFKLKSKIETSNNRHEYIPNNVNGDIVFNNVSFKYPHSKEIALKNISLKIPEGKIIGLVGTNGAGKTTLIKLLCKLYNPDAGNITYGGKNIKNFSTKSYRSKISAVFQDFVKYNLSVKENISLGDTNKDSTLEMLKKASCDAEVVELIESFPEKFDTILGRIFKDGHEISMGQWQRIAIARALYRDSKIIILDEATSALDSISENNIFNSLRSKIGNRSALVISHRLSTIKQADFIYVMDNKEIVEAGTHDELIYKNGIYSSLYNTNDHNEILAS